MSMINRRTFGKLAAGLAAVAAMASQASAQTTIRLAHHLPETSEQHIAATRFAELVDERSNGELKVVVVPAGQMGGQREIIESVQMGTLEMGYGESGLYANYVPAFGVLTLPYLYNGREHWTDVVTGDIGTGLSEELEQATGLVVMNWILAGYRDTYSKGKVLDTPAAFDGVKIRVPESPVFIETFRALNAQPTPIPSPEIYTALQTGVVSAMEGTPEVGYIQKMYEVADNLNMTRHILFDGSFVTSRSFLESLPEDQREILLTAAEEVAALQRQESPEREAAWFEKLAETGITINEFDLAPFREALVPVQDSFAEKAKATDVVAAIRAAGGE